MALAASLMLTACASGGTSPLGDAVSGLLPGGGSDYAEQAGALEYASLALDASDRSGLIVLGAIAGHTTYWPTGQRGMLVLYRDGLQATSGMGNDLLETRYLPLDGSDHDGQFVPWQQQAPGEFRLVRRWQESDGLPRQLGARGTLNCQGPETLSLPLGDQRLQRCDMALQWENGRLTTTTLWRDPDTLRLWAEDGHPWPGAPRLQWQVARAWW